MSLAQYLQEKKLPSIEETTLSAKKEAILKKELYKHKGSSPSQPHRQTQQQQQQVLKKRQKAKSNLGSRAAESKKRDKLSDSLQEVQDKMIEKNFNIKQRAVNETPPMTGF